MSHRIPVYTPATIRYDTIRDATLTCALKLSRVSLIYRTEPTPKSGKKVKTDMLSKQSGESVESVPKKKKRKGYGGKDLQKRKVLSLE